MIKQNGILIYLISAVVILISVTGIAYDLKMLADKEFDIASGLELSMEADNKESDVKVVDTDHIRISLSHGNSWSFSADGKNSVTIYNDASKKSGSGGVLVSIMAFPLDDAEYEVFPDYSVIGEAEGMRYIAVYPTDVQFDPENNQAMEDYRAVMKEINKIRNNDADSPVVIKGR